ncbi:hypothetical protein [Arcobacter aquimarinus]|uniref:Lipoprotein n=1 Tax=Arcobacter aquimarinus TaxID=1315211 RepID=A0AAE7E2X6_9BACT|nr:hypothetical protein [Arcobacter aquimarinus]QKE27116.1 hypothetical protein AAQM_2419 [Arcobacter aquimarinus]
MIFSLFIFTGCFNTTQPQLNSSSATILIKTPQMKFYDKGFIYKYKEFTQVQIFSAGTAILDMKIYNDRICRTTFKCQDLKTFNKENLSSSYPDNFLKELFEKEQKEVIHRDKQNDILIKIIRD